MPSIVEPWSETFTVRSFDIDGQGRAHLRSLANYLQEAAWAHAHHLGLSVQQLVGQKLTWMLVRLHLRLDSWPRWMDVLRIETWPSGRDAVVAHRVFEIFDGTGKRIGAASSSWMVVDLIRRRPVRLPKPVRELELPVRRGALHEPPGTPPEIATVERERSFEVRRSQIDINGHANQSAYIDWAAEPISEEFWKGKTLRSLEIAFLAEARQGDGVISQVGPGPEEGVLLHRLQRLSDGSELARLRTRWE